MLQVISENVAGQLANCTYSRCVTHILACHARSSLSLFLLIFSKPCHHQICLYVWIVIGCRSLYTKPKHNQGRWTVYLSRSRNYCCTLKIAHILRVSSGDVVLKKKMWYHKQGGLAKCMIGIIPTATMYNRGQWFLWTTVFHSFFKLPPYKSWLCPWSQSCGFIS